jgi:hypothetical protein
MICLLCIFLYSNPAQGMMCFMCSESVLQKFYLKFTNTRMYASKKNLQMRNHTQKNNWGILRCNIKIGISEAKDLWLKFKLTPIFLFVVLDWNFEILRVKKLRIQVFPTYSVYLCCFFLFWISGHFPLCYDSLDVVGKLYWLKQKCCSWV